MIKLTSIYYTGSYGSQRAVIEIDGERFNVEFRYECIAKPYFHVWQDGKTYGVERWIRSSATGNRLAITKDCLKTSREIKEHTGYGTAAIRNAILNQVEGLDA